ncbi:MAG: hypothetical protein AAFR38_02935 [Planctomycetota bacterium]
MADRGRARADQIVARLVLMRDRAPPVPASLAVRQIAESQLGLIRAWLHAPACGASEIARTLIESSSALLIAQGWAH